MRRNWTRLDDNWAANRKVKKVTRKYGPTAGAYWTLIIAKAHAVSHHKDNPDGAIKCTIQDLADELHDRHNRTEMWESMVKAGLIHITGRGWKEDHEADITIRLNDTQWLTPKGSSAERMKLMREKDADLQGSVTECDASVTECDERVTQTETYTETETKKKKEEGSHADPESWLKSDAVYTPPPTDPMLKFVAEASAILGEVYADTAVQDVAVAIYRSSIRTGPMITTYPVEQWMRAVRQMVDAIKDGRMKDPTKFGGWLNRTVATAIETPGLKDGVGEPAEDPDVVRVREMAARYNTEGAA